jgi:hypothetical protein
MLAQLKGGPFRISNEASITVCAQPQAAIDQRDAHSRASREFSRLYEPSEGSEHIKSAEFWD